MNLKRLCWVVPVGVILLSVGTFNLAAQDAATEMTAAEAPGTVYASGLDNPRGLKFGSDGILYVAESGQGGTTSSTTSDDCEQVVEPVGPYTAGASVARVSRISPDGERTTVVDGLPSSQTSRGLVSGTADIALIDDRLYVLISGAGCSHGVKDMPNGILRVNADGSTTQIADLSAFWQANPVNNPQPADFEPDGTPYSMISVDGNLYVIEPNHGELDQITPDGTISRVIDISDSQGHIVPTSVAFHDGDFYIGNLSIFPVHVGSAGILEVNGAGEVGNWTSGLTMVTGVAFDETGQLYALESSTLDNAMPTPGTGRVVRINLETGNIEEVASGLTLPTAMTFGPDGALYVSNFGFGFPPGSGEIRRIEIP